jgi:hypothetical protein
MTVVIQDKFILLASLCLGIWGILGILGAVIPILNYMVTGRARTISPDKQWNIIMKGKKARQFVLARFCFVGGIAFSFFTIWTSLSFWWIGWVVALPSIPFWLNATVNADRVPRKHILFEIEDLWHS